MIFFGKPVSTPDQVRGRLFPDHALGKTSTCPVQPGKRDTYRPDNCRLDTCGLDGWRARPDLALTFCIVFPEQASPLFGNALKGGGPSGGWPTASMGIRQLLLKR